MSTLLIVVIAVLYYGSGVCGFIYWWTIDFDFCVEDLYKAAVAGLAGPLAWYIGKTIHSPNGNVIIKQRKNG